MKILIIGDADSIYIEGYIRNIFSNNDFIVLATEKNNNIEYSRFYANNNINVECFSDLYISNIPGIRNFIGTIIFSKKLIKKYGFFDFIHIHGLNHYRGNLAINVMNIKTKLIISVWGSELLRSNKKQISIYKKYYDIANKVTFENRNVLNKFLTEYPKIDNKKLYIINFGDEIFDYIDNIQKPNKINYLKSIDINKKYFIISVGYNRNKAHHHYEILESILKLPREIQQQILIVLCMTYGPHDYEYENKVNCLLKSFHGISKIYTEFLNKQNMSELLSAVDIFIHGQTTDSQSMTLMEYLYTNTIVLNGSWLEYPIIEDNKIFMIKYNKYSEISNLLLKIINNFNYYFNKTNFNHDALEKIFNWKCVKNDWINLYL